MTTQIEEIFTEYYSTTDFQKWIDEQKIRHQQNRDYELSIKEIDTGYLYRIHKPMPTATTPSPNNNYQKFITALAIAILVSVVIAYFATHIPY